MEPPVRGNNSNTKSLSLGVLRIVHRYVDDFVLVRKVRAGSLSPSQVEHVLRASGADTEEIRAVLEEYRRIQDR
ncbi:MAG: hypothetical protein AB1733_20330 [Thermodesulfobacteriota bacterium]